MTTESLREEIENWIDCKLYGNDSKTWVTQGILYIIKKRIDSRIQDYTINSFAESDEVVAELEDLKKEILK